MLSTRTLRLAAAPIAVAAAIGFAACGGDDGDEAASEAEAIALAEWVTQADEICAESNATLEEEATAYIEDIGAAPTEEEAETLVSDFFVPTYEDQVEQLRELPPPDEQADTVDAMLSAVEEGISAIEDDPAAILQEETPSGFAEANELAGELGMEECGE